MSLRRPASISTAFSQNGVTVANYPFATLSVNGRYRFYAVNLTTGQAFSLGRFDEAVVDIAIPLNQ